MSASTIYTLIAYRPDGLDTCLGCVMGTSSSDFDIKVFTDQSALVAAWAKAATDAPDGREYATTEFTLLLNGLDSDHDYNDYEASSERMQIDALVRAETQRLALIKQEAVRAAEKQAKRAEEDRREAAERKLLADLTSKYKDKP